MRRPGTEDLDAIGVHLRRIVPQEYEDLNGHVNVRRHLQMLYEGAEQLYENEWGIDDRLAKEEGEGTFSLEQHQRFYREIMVGEEVSVHIRMLDRSSKIFHGQQILFNRSTGEVASTNEFVDGYVDLESRRITSMPEWFADRIDAVLARHRELDWELPLGGRLGVRS